MQTRVAVQRLIRRRLEWFDGTHGGGDEVGRRRVGLVRQLPVQVGAQRVDSMIVDEARVAAHVARIHGQVVEYGLEVDILLRARPGHQLYAVSFGQQLTVLLDDAGGRRARYVRVHYVGIVVDENVRMVIVRLSTDGAAHRLVMMLLCVVLVAVVLVLVRRLIVAVGKAETLLQSFVDQIVHGFDCDRLPVNDGVDYLIFSVLMSKYRRV